MLQINELRIMRFYILSLVCSALAEGLISSNRLYFKSTDPPWISTTTSTTRAPTTTTMPTTTTASTTTTTTSTTVKPSRVLPQLFVDPNRISVSGFSSGGTMAQQMFVSHSSIIQGCGTISHSFYRCGPGNGDVDMYDYTCSSYYHPGSSIYDPKWAIADLQTYAAQGIIDPVINLRNKPLYIFAGSSSFFFNLDYGLGAATLFEDFIGNHSAIKTRVQDANMTLPTGNPSMPSCRGEQNDLFISNCGFSAAFEVLQWLLGSTTVATYPKPEGTKFQPLLEFDQSEFLNVDNVAEGGAGMDASGFYYVPMSCRQSSNGCPLHIYFHGCYVGKEFAGSHHIVNSGYLEVAELNGIVMLFPQSHTTPANEYGCWDTYGYGSKSHYATKLGAQVKSIRNMINRVAGIQIE